MIGAFGAKRFILIVGDEGTVLLRMQGATVKDRCFAPSAEPEDRVDLEAMLADAPRLPVTILVDVLEQSFVKDTIPPVGLLDEAGVLQRKLRTTFPDARIKGALSLGRDKKQMRRDKRFMFVALPESPAVEGWLDFIRDLRNPVASIALLPVESAGLAAHLSAQLHDKDKIPDWVVLNTRQRTGGFRQIVINKGELVFSRLTQSLHADVSAADIATTIEREHKLTMGYLRRMAFNKDQGLDVIVLAQPDVEEELVRRGFAKGDLRVMSPAAAAQLCKLQGVASDDDDYGEILHGAWLAQRRRPVLPLMPEEIMQHRLEVHTVQVSYAVTALCVFYLSFGLGNTFLESLRLEEQSDAYETEAQELQAELDDAMENVGKFKVSAPEVQDTIDLFERLSVEAPSPMRILARIALELGPDARVHELTWNVITDAVTGRTARLVLRFDILDAGGEVQRAIESSDLLLAQLRKLFPDYLVEVTAPPIDILPSQSLSGVVDLTAPEDRVDEQTFRTEITIWVPAVWIPEDLNS